MKTITERIIKKRSSLCGRDHTFSRPCDGFWDKWVSLNQRTVSVDSQLYDEYRIPYEDIYESQLTYESFFTNEEKINRIGGKLKDEYFAFKKDVDYINIFYFEFFSRLGMTDDVNYIIEALQTHNVKKVFSEKTKRDINEGRIPREKFISMPTIQYARKYAFSDPDKVRKREEKSINANLRNNYKKIGETYLKETKLYPFYPKHNHTAMEILGGALYVTPTQLAIDCDKFIEIYCDHLAASESISGKLHQQAANTINQFFNGVEITPVELKRYFKLEDGIIKANLKSMKRENYSRLGWRDCK